MKHEKIVKKIKRACKSGNAGQLGRKNNDECYTSKQDVYNELSQWAALDKFRNKNIICPCDTEESAFVQVLTENKEAWGIKSINYSHYNPDTFEGTRFQYIDYSKYDVCITNPPFSLKAEFMSCIVDKIDFIVLLPFVSRNKNPIGIPLMLNKAYLGYGVECHLCFKNPTKENNYSGTKIVNCDWITSFPEAQAERNARHFKSGVKYDLYKDEFEVVDKMVMKDDTCPIRVSMSTYPEDYDGWMFANIGVLDNLDQETYEWYSTDTTGFFNHDPVGKTLSPFKGHWTCDKIAIGNRKLFGGIVFRKKQGG